MVKKLLGILVLSAAIALSMPGATGDTFFSSPVREAVMQDVVHDARPRGQVRRNAKGQAASVPDVPMMLPVTGGE